jgi:NAD(P)H-dependent FMN reductase
MNVLVFAASTRRESLNSRLAAHAADLVRGLGHTVDHATLRDFDMPLFDGDVEATTGLPPGALALKRRLEAATAVVLATPEYNYSIPGTLKNAIDWTSRARPMPWRGRSMYLMSASPSPIGGIRGLWQTRIPLEGCGAHVYPDMFALARADQAFDAAGGLADAGMEARLHKELAAFLRVAEAVAPVL